MSTPRKTPVVTKRIVALYDMHVPLNIDLKGVLAYIKDRRPTDLIIGGDYLNLEYMSHWNDTLFPTIGFEKVGKMLNQEFEAGIKVLKDINAVLPENCNKFFIPGNHEAWALEACLKYPQLAGGLDLGVSKLTFKSDLAKIKKQVLANLLRKFLKTDEIGMKVLDYEKELTIGKQTFIHGHTVSSPTAMQKQYPACNVICGHHHSELIITTHNSGQERKANQYTFVPCLTRLSPGYLKNSSTRWLNGLYTSDVLSNGLFAGHVVKVLDGYVIEGGKIYG
jgi:hypothetical protein